MEILSGSLGLAAIRGSLMVSGFSESKYTNKFMWGTILNTKSRDRRNGYGRYNPDAASRPTFYMSDELLRVIEIQAQQERASRSSFVASLLGFLLLSPAGQQLRKNAWYSNRTLVQELKQFLILLQERLPLEKINQLAVASQRSLPQMLTYLVLQGLQTYQESNWLNVESNTNKGCHSGLRGLMGNKEKSESQG